MRKSYLTTLLSVGVALASLSSCSRSNYAFNPSTPAYLGSERAHSTAAPVADATASAEVAAPVAVEVPAKVAAAALARPRAAAHRVARASAPVAVATEAAAPVAAHTTFTKAERKELKQLMRQAKATSPKAVADGGKSQIVALVLCAFLGGLGVHRFYLGYTGIGIHMLLTLGLFGILTLIDFVRILTGSLKPKDGDYTTKL